MFPPVLHQGNKSCVTCESCHTLCRHHAVRTAQRTVPAKNKVSRNLIPFPFALDLPQRPWRACSAISGSESLAAWLKAGRVETSPMLPNAIQTVCSKPRRFVLNIATGKGLIGS